MSNILNLWLVLDTPDRRLKVVKNSDKFFCGASNTVRERAILPLESEFDITFEDNRKTYKLMFRALDPKECFSFSKKYSSSSSDDEFENEYQEMFNIPDCLKNWDQYLKGLKYYGEHFDVRDFFPLFKQKIRDSFSNSSVSEYENILLWFVSKYAQPEYITWTRYSERRPTIMSVPVVAIEGFDTVAVWKFSKETDNLSLAGLEDGFDPNSRYCVWNFQKECVERSNGKVWFKKFNNPEEKIEMDKIIAVLSLLFQK